MVKLIGVVGKAGSGKDSFADILVQEHNYCKIAFADPLKRYCMDLFGFTEEQLWGPSINRSIPDKRYKTYEVQLEPSAGELSHAVADLMTQYLTPREALQKIGTDGVRASYEDAWVDYFLRTVNLLMSSNIYRYKKTIGVYSVIDPSYIELFSGKYPTGIINSDVRFCNEAKKIKQAEGLLVKIIRPGAGLKGNHGQHSSETEQDQIPHSWFNHVIINDTTLDDLKYKIKLILE